MDQRNERPAIYWLLNIVHWLRSCKLYLQYGDIGCGVSNSGIQNYVDFLHEKNWFQENFDTIWNGTMQSRPYFYKTNFFINDWFEKSYNQKTAGICFKILLWFKDCNICCWKSKFPDFSKGKLFSLKLLMLLSKI